MTNTELSSNFQINSQLKNALPCQLNLRVQLRRNLIQLPFQQQSHFFVCNMNIHLLKSFLQLWAIHTSYTDTEQMVITNSNHNLIVVKCNFHFYFLLTNFFSDQRGWPCEFRCQHCSQVRDTSLWYVKIILEFKDQAPVVQRVDTSTVDDKEKDDT